MCHSRPILLVEDNPDDEQLTLRALRRNTIAPTIRVARDGAEAWDVLMTEDPLPCLVLLDLKLPKLSGFEVLQRIRNHDRTRLLPVVMLTSSGEERDIFDSYNLHANSYVQKPVNFNQFIEAVSRLGLYWLVVNRPVPLETERC